MSDTIRRSHLVYSAGVGGLTILKSGTSVICSGLDYWFRDENGSISPEAVLANQVSDWRLEERVRVAELRMPPAAPDDKPTWAKQAPGAVGVPFQRFPLWHVCPSCRRLSYEKNLSDNPLYCDRCSKAKGYGPRLIQVPLVAACEAGHLEEFPWHYWLKGCSCDEPELTLRQRGGAGLGNFKLNCNRCGSSRGLSGALTSDGIRPCSGARPWLGANPGQDKCEKMAQGVLRNSASIYYSNVAASVFIPRKDGHAPDALIDLFRLPGGPMATVIGMSQNPKTLLTAARQILTVQIKEYSDAEVLAAIGAVKSEAPVASVAPDELDYRYAEFEVLSESEDEPGIRVRAKTRGDYDFPDDRLQSISLVESLTVTKVLTGFGRLVPSSSGSGEATGAQLWRDFPKNPKRRWLPAVQVRGEGIFLAFDEAQVREWECKAPVLQRMARLTQAAEASRYASKDFGTIDARFVMLHTFSHLLMNRLVFEAGYSATSLSERIYSRSPGEGGSPMAGILIYTASGDAEGSLGGLVRLGKPGHLEGLISDAIDSARWCSSDPICMELGGSHGQGPDGLNLAACHSCVHMPETACEAFNVLMDRALVIGSLEDSNLGFFS